ncbi:MAG TPA: aldehyde dehydrogenase family protein, partial [Arthrobacter sp.]|nr:aldehyde dehydrogenase family protein [Arthrobacter sp.]
MSTQPATAAATYQDLLARIAPQGESRAINDPATGEEVGRAPVHTTADLDAAVASARAAQPAWGALSHAERSDHLNRAADAIEAHAEALAELLSREQGKPLNGPNARFEVGACSAWLRATAAFELEPDVVVDEEGTHAAVHYRPLGVVGAIVPWNFPTTLLSNKLAPAVVAGNTVVAKPAG